jgi:hypothetical protein
MMMKKITVQFSAEELKALVIAVGTPILPCEVHWPLDSGTELIF